MEPIAEPQQNSANLTLNDSLPMGEPALMSDEKPMNSVGLRGKSYWFTKENAKAMSAKAHEAKRQRLERLRQAAEPITAGEQEYRVFRLTRTREQLLALDRQLEKETDPKSVKAICDAIARLCDVEQRLAMRPLPGSQRPTRQRTPKSGSAEPLDE